MQKAITFVLIGLSVITGVLFASILCYGFAAGYLNGPDIPPEDTPVVANLPTVTPLPPVVETSLPEALEPTVTSQPATKEPVKLDPTNAPAAGQPDDGLTWQGLQLDVTNVNYNAWPLIKAQNQFNNPPLDGMTMLMITLRATNLEGTPGEPVQIRDSHVKLIGNKNVVYKSYEVGCGVVPDGLNGVVDVGDSMDGNVCFQVSPEEGEFQLIYEPFDAPATYVTVPAPDESDGLIDVNASPVIVEAEQLTNTGLQIDIVGANYNAWPLIKAQNHNNDAPLDGMTMLLITVRVSGSSEISDGVVRVEAADFESIGDKKQMYKTFELSCGVIPDRLDGVVSQGSAMDGNICFQIPVDETNLQLIYKPSHNSPPAYYNLPDPDVASEE